MTRPDQRWTNKTVQQTYYSSLRQQGKLSGTIKRAVEKWEHRRRCRDQGREIIPQCSFNPQPQARRSVATIELSRELAAQTLASAKDKNRRLKNWVGAEPDRTSKSASVRCVSNGPYSARCRYEHVTYYATIRHCGAVSPRRLLYFCGEKRRIIRACKGWVYDRDDIGLYIVREGEARQEYRYHFVGRDLANTSTLRAAAIAHEHAQKQAAAEARKRRAASRQLQALRTRARKIGVWISARDSRRSGNCPAGTKRWAESHALDSRRRYPIAVIERIGSSSSWGHEIDRAIDAAIDRAATELRQGYCVVD